MGTGTVDEADWCPASNAEPCQEAPRTLILKTPNGQSHFAGEYELVLERANGKPLWKRKGSTNHWLFCFPPRWNFSGAESKQNGFNKSEGWLSSTLPESTSE